jgi:hypothetical protein
MNIPSLTAKLVFFALVVPAVCSAQAVRWKDENGVTHFGDSIPPEYADKDRDVLNEQGIVVDQKIGSRADDLADEAAKAEERRRQAERDRVLLQSYTTAADIEAMRDRRVNQMDAQIRNAEASLADVKARHAQHLQNASRFKPYSKEENAREIPVQLADNIAQAENSIARYEAALALYRKDREALVVSFASDLARFKELKNL